MEGEMRERRGAREGGTEREGGSLVARRSHPPGERTSSVLKKNSCHRRLSTCFNTIGQLYELELYHNTFNQSIKFLLE